MTKEQFIENIAKYVQKYAPKYDISVCSPIIAQACLESGYGASELAKVHNYFGMKYRANRCPTSNGTIKKVGSEQNANGSYSSSNMTWFKFPDMESGVIGYFDFTNISTYKNLKGITDPRIYLERIKSDGYATSLKYVDNLMSVITSNNLTKYDTTSAVEMKGETPMVSITKDITKINRTVMSNKKNKYIVIHYTGNKTDKAKSNANYFRSTNRGASAHYFVDDTSIYQVVEDKDAAWSVGRNYGKNNLFGVVTNENSINIEMCSTDGFITPDTFKNTVELTKMLMSKYSIPAKNVYRHYDVCTKRCPGWNGWVPKNESEWERFKNAISVDSATTHIETPAPVVAPVQTSVSYYPKFDAISIVDGLRSIGVNNSMANRKKIAEANGIKGYTGTPAQNVKLLSLARQSKLVRA